MRPIRITGVTGVSPWVPLDVYSPAQAIVTSSVAALVVEWTVDNIFDLSIVPVLVAGALASGTFTLPPGAKAVRGTGMAPADIMVVSQQGIA